MTAEVPLAMESFLRKRLIFYIYLQLSGVSLRLKCRNKRQKDMKSLIATLMVALAACMPVHAQRSAYGQVSDAAQAADTAGIVAYSDTTVVDTAATEPVVDNGGGSRWELSIKDVDEPFTLIAYLATIGVGGVIVAVFFVLLCLLTVFSPVILIAVVLYMVMKRKNARYRLVEKAMETGTPIPDEIRRSETLDGGMLWRRGIRNASIGLGIVAFAICVGSGWVAGIGLIVAVYGAGQAVIARTSGKDKGDNESREDGNL